ncbi:hypothetical protein SAY86_017690 [Trapa natans]|uniref:C2H2-type domain-containing protein n=1 Tax=Trapa natans TaxID=22666 RepID=A0AAN7M5J3_TRANT|nr:hypothetical protein SAY86_017690 [Trapa natans]
MEDHAGPIVKGKRTKRQRPQSPVPFEVADSSPTTATSSAELFSTTTEEEEDMANCLILLAQGRHEYFPSQPVCPPPVVSTFDEPAAAAAPKFTSRRYLETATSTGSRAGYYVYQCKTCDRTFPSFQALGGHRASHKKPKNNSGGRFADSLGLPSPTSVERKQIFTLLPSPPEDEEGQFRKFSSLSLQLGNCNNNNVNRNNGNGGKVHECSICGAEFTSGQALGGHMRRHRATPIGISIHNAIPSPAGAITALSLANFGGLEEPSPPPTQAADPTKADNLSLDLDLNLPASAHDHQADHPESRGPSEFPSLLKKPSPSPSFSQHQVEQKSQPAADKSSIVFSGTPALVGCHY